MKGILHGLELTWKKGHKKVRIQTDSQSVILLIMTEDPPILHQHASEVIEICESCNGTSRLKFNTYIKKTMAQQISSTQVSRSFPLLIVISVIS
ncbi:hypothetical protein LINPERPRIM_LOCUS30379 [Linum perenne]